MQIGQLAVIAIMSAAFVFANTVCLAKNDFEMFRYI